MMKRLEVLLDDSGSMRVLLVLQDSRGTIAMEGEVTPGDDLHLAALLAMREAALKMLARAEEAPHAVTSAEAGLPMERRN